MLRIVPCIRDQAQAFIAEHHRHNRRPQGAVFYLAVADAERIRGVAVIGRPTARQLDDGETLEVTRVCTDGARNAPSMLYGRAIRVARLLGYRRLYTYTLQSEPGSSLRAAGFTLDAQLAARPTVPRRPLQLGMLDEHPTRPEAPKCRWVVLL